MCGGVVANDTISFRKLIVLPSWVGDIVVCSYHELQDTVFKYCEPVGM